MWLMEFGHIDEVVFYVFCAAAAVVCVLAVANMLAGLCIKNVSGVTSLDFMTSCGTVLLSYTVLVRGLKPSWGSAEEFETICEFYPATLLTGLTLFVGGLLCKGWGIYVVNRYENKHQQPLNLEWRPNLWLLLLLIISAAASLVWCVRDTPEIKYIDRDDDSTGRKANAKTYECEYEHEVEWMVVTSAWHALLLIFAALAVIPNCKISHTSEANTHAVVTLNTLVATVVGICVYFLYGDYDDDNDDDTNEYAINGGLILWACFFSNALALGVRLCCLRSSDRSGRYQTESMQRLDNYDTINEEKRAAAHDDEHRAGIEEDATKFDY